MYIGAGLALASVTLFYKSLPLLGYAGLFFLASHLFVVWYGEPLGKSMKHIVAKSGDGCQDYKPHRILVPLTLGWSRLARGSFPTLARLFTKGG